MKHVTLKVVKTGRPAGSDCEHIVKIEIKEEGKPTRVGRLPGGDEENAKGMAESLKALADTGLDLSELLPDAKEANEA